MQTIGQRMRRFRQEKGLSLTEMEKATGISRTSITLYESDIHNPNLMNATTICGVLDITIDELVGLKEPMRKGPRDIPVTALLEGLAEECCELGQAALKLARAMRGENPTPKPASRCLKSLLEEIADVQLYLDRLRAEDVYADADVKEVKASKAARWERRLNDGKV